MTKSGYRTAELATVSSKITGYLLNLDHRVGRHKAAWFIARGFQVDFDMLSTAELFRHGRPSRSVGEYATKHGRPTSTRGRSNARMTRARGCARVGGAPALTSVGPSLPHTQREARRYRHYDQHRP
ncbi:DUF6883 domain-containing protein [Methylobacterium sp. NPDC080182]|uniref:DUF6883 domain-containing protein n=1 Tax=Methylobacterium sp. NPDC080182 TaxID=3390590 RepID=UPI003D07DCAF